MVEWNKDYPKSQNLRDMRGLAKSDITLHMRRKDWEYRTSIPGWNVSWEMVPDPGPQKISAGLFERNMTRVLRSLGKAR